MFQDPSDPLDVPHRDTAAYRIGSQVNDHETRLKLLEHETGNLAECVKCLDRRLNTHERDDNIQQRKILMTVVLTILSATGGVLFMLFQLLTIGKHT